MNLRSALISLVVLAVVSGCSTSQKAPVTVVAPAGPATVAQAQAIDDHLQKLTKAADAAADALSKASASAGAIKTMNSGQPEGPRTVGVDGEAGLIQAVAGEPKAADQIAAAERARIVAEGKADQIAKAYAAAQQQADATGKALTDSKAALAESQAALAKAKADAAAEQQQLQAKYQSHIDQMQRDAEKRVEEARSQAKAEQRRQLTWIFFGGAALLTALGIAVMFLGASVPIFGPKAGISLLASGAGLAGLGTIINVVQNFADDHPTAVWATVCVCLAGFAVAIGMMVANHHHALDQAKAQAKPLIDKAKAEEQQIIARVSELISKAKGAV